MTPAMRELLAALAAATDVPYPADSGRDAERAHKLLLIDRMSSLRAVLNQVASNNKVSAAQLGGQAELLREWTANSPVTYEPYQRPAPQDLPAEATP
jgi:hypothetical protein